MINSNSNLAVITLFKSYNMKRTSLLITILSLTILNVNGQNNACLAPSLLNSLGFSNVAANVVNNGTCQKYFATNGACVAPWSIISFLNNNNAWLQTIAINANNFALQYINATVYFGTQQGWINSATQVPSSPPSFWSSIGSFLSKIYNRAISLFSSLVGWVQTLFNKNVGSINPCFQAIANITNGVYCVATSSNNVTSSIVQSSIANTWSIAVDLQSAGNALQACIPLIDTYCSLAYGVSISNSASPFNQTFNWADGGLSINDCYNIRNQTNQTASANIIALNNYLAGIFATNWIRFVPSAASIINLGNFLAGNQNVTSYIPIQQGPIGNGLNLIAIGQINENVYADGLVSGQVGLIYGSAFALIYTFFFALAALLI